MKSGKHAGRVFATLAVLFWVAWPAPAGEKDRPRVIATLFPQYDFARQIADDKAEVTLLLPPGSESHSFEPTPADMKEISTADLFIYTGEYMEPWAKRLADSTAGAGGATIVDASRGVATHRTEDGRDDHEEGEYHEHVDEGESAAEPHFHEFDPHIWLDPALAAIMVDNIAAALVRRDGANADFYRANAKALRGELERLDADFRAVVEKSPRGTLVFGERFAFGYFFRRYGLEEIGAYKSCAPGAEPGLSAVIAVVDYVRKNGVKFIYLEAMATGRISEIIRAETKAEILKVDSLHNPPAERLRAGVRFQDIMAENMAAFAKGLQ